MGFEEAGKEDLAPSSLYMMKVVYLALAVGVAGSKHVVSAHGRGLHVGWDIYRKRALDPSKWRRRYCRGIYHDLKLLQVFTIDRCD